MKSNHPRTPRRNHQAAVALARTAPVATPSGSDLIAGLQRFAGAVIRAAADVRKASAQRRRERRARSELRRIDPRVLQDIGVNRSEIGSVVRHGDSDFTRRPR